MNTLPEGYRALRSIDLVHNKREAVAVNLLSIAITLVLIVLGFLIDPRSSGDAIQFPRIVPMLLLLLGIVAYTLAHELIHGVFMKAYSGQKPHYGFKGIYAYAGCDALFTRRQYLIVGFAPVVLLGLLLAVLNAALDSTHFWYIYILQIVNLSGAAGDIYVGWRITQVPRDALIRDTGTGMTIYSAATPKPRRGTARRTRTR